MTKYQAICVFLEGDVKGFTKIVQQKKGLKFIVKLENVPPGYHGFHIHETGDLSRGCDSLCKHYNPYNTLHGGLNTKIRHLGDLGNIYANKQGVVNTEIIAQDISIVGKNPILGRSLVIHEDKDDLGKGKGDSKITGNSGKRIACGVIGISEEFSKQLDSYFN